MNNNVTYGAIGLLVGLIAIVAAYVLYGGLSAATDYDGSLYSGTKYTLDERESSLYVQCRTDISRLERDFKETDPENGCACIADTLTKFAGKRDWNQLISMTTFKRELEVSSDGKRGLALGQSQLKSFANANSTDVTSTMGIYYAIRDTEMACGLVGDTAGMNATQPRTETSQTKAQAAPEYGSKIVILPNKDGSGRTATVYNEHGQKTQSLSLRGTQGFVVNAASGKTFVSPK